MCYVMRLWILFSRLTEYDEMERVTSFILQAQKMPFNFCV
jgi:hypothetical protein